MASWVIGPKDFIPFVKASNLIEGIDRPATPQELEAHDFLLKFNGQLTAGWLCEFVNQIAPGNQIRDTKGMNVRVGKHVPILGGPEVPARLTHWLKNQIYCSPIVAYAMFENLHPFTDGNGRLGRALYLRSKMEQGEDTQRLFEGKILEDMHYGMLRAFDLGAWRHTV